MRLLNKNYGIENPHGLMHMAKEIILFVATMPAEVTPELIDFCRELDPDTQPVYLNVQPMAGAEQLRCYTNSEMAAIQFGGSKQTGWMIFTYKNWYACAEHHAVWRKPDGSMVCVTPHFDGMKRMLFLPSNIDHPSYLGGTPPTRYRLLTDHEHLREYLKWQLKSVDFKSNPMLNQGNPVTAYEHNATMALRKYQRFLDARIERKKLEKHRAERKAKRKQRR